MLTFWPMITSKVIGGLKFNEFNDLKCKYYSNFKSIGWNLRILENMAQIGLLAYVDLFVQPNFTNLWCGTVARSVTLISENFTMIGFKWFGLEASRQTNKHTHKHTNRGDQHTCPKNFFFLPSNKQRHKQREAINIVVHFYFFLPSNKRTQMQYPLRILRRG